MSSIFMRIFMGKTKREKRKVIYQFQDKNRFLSNFYPCDVTFDGVDYSSVENAYMAWKTLDPALRREIAALSPGDAKKRSRMPDFILRPDYSDEGRLAIMHDLLLQKFSDRNPKLLQQLLKTGDALLMEGNSWTDFFFGFDLLAGLGLNHLGRMLMQIRAQRAAER